MAIEKFNNITPEIHESVYVHESAVIIGDVKIGKDCSIWPFAVIRGDVAPIVIDEGTNIQEHVTIHAEPGFPVSIGKRVTIGHHALVHGAIIEDDVLIGMDSIILDGSVIKRFSLVGAQALVTSMKTFDEQTLILGSPAKALRTLNEQEVQGILDNGQAYIDLKQQVMKEKYD